MTIATFLSYASKTLEAAGIQTARLDALVIMERTLRHNKAWLLGHGEEPIPPEKHADLHAKVARRAKREPLAYMLGQQEFYGRQFTVNPYVLIPRPESEQLISLLKTLPLPDNARLLDVGTGSGALAITAACELPHLVVEACDISPDALEVGARNARQLNATVRFFRSDLLQAAEKTYDCIIANLPYVAPGWQRSPETNFEPATALFSDDNGLAHIKKLLVNAPHYLQPNGWLLLEADPRQFGDIKKVAAHAFTIAHSQGFTLALQKI